MITPLLTVLDAAAEVLPVATRYRWATLVGGRPHVHVGNGDFVPVAEDATGGWSYWRALGPAQVGQADIGEACVGFRVTLPLRFVAWVDREECTPAIMDAVHAIRASRSALVTAIGAADATFERIAWQVDGVGAQEFRPEPVWPTHKMLVNIDVTLVVEGNEACVSGCAEAVSVLCRLMAAASIEEIRDCLGERLADVCELDCLPATFTVNGTDGEPIPSGGNAVLQVLQGGVPVGTFDPVTGIHTVDECPEGCDAPYVIRWPWLPPGGGIEVPYVDIVREDEPCGKVEDWDCDTEVPNTVVIEGCGCPRANALYVKEDSAVEFYVNKAGNRFISGQGQVLPGQAPYRYFIVSVSPSATFYRSATFHNSLMDVDDWEVISGPAPAPSGQRVGTIADLIKASCDICPPPPEPCPVTIEVYNTDAELVDDATIPDPCEQEGPVVLTAPDAIVTRDGEPFGTVPSGGTINVPSDCPPPEPCEPFTQDFDGLPLPDITAPCGESQSLGCDTPLPFAVVEDGAALSGNYLPDGDNFERDATHFFEYTGTRWILDRTPGSNLQAAPGPRGDGPWDADWSGASPSITVRQGTIGDYCGGDCPPPEPCPDLCDLLGEVEPGDIEGDVLDCLDCDQKIAATESLVFFERSAITCMEAEIATWGLMLWLDSADTATLFDATAGGSLPAIGAGVARWEDKSGNAYHVTQGTAGARPSRQSTGLLFDGDDDQMDRTTPTDLLRNVSGATIVIAARRMSAQTGVRNYFGHSVGTGSVSRSLMGFGPSIQGARAGGRRLDPDGLNAAENTTTPVSLVSNHLQVARFDYAGDRLDVYLDDMATASASNTAFHTASSGQNTSSTASLDLYVGSSGGTAKTNVLMQSVHVFHTALTQAQREFLKRYLILKYPAIQ